MMRLSICSVLLMVFSIVLPLRAAADVDEARREFEKGRQLFEAGDYREAAEAFRRANEEQPNWRLLYNIGQCEAAEKNYGLALESLEAYLAHGGDDVPDRSAEAAGRFCAR
jgi:tetratricopeptide (TPR) repeat protein